ncbi:hypothetical protein H4Q26_014235 [Puccinia striiformis f. sp. tritici PST-130]|nr:hypothetical protein H4Q26_014235 [Puccinia striiformis f. sp. tritici PST-130]
MQLLQGWVFSSSTLSTLKYTNEKLSLLKSLRGEASSAAATSPAERARQGDSILINGLSDLSAGNHDNKRNFIRIRTYDPSRVAGLYSIPEKIL